MGYNIDPCYIAVEYNVMLNMIKKGGELKLILWLKKTPHISPVRVSYGLSFLMNFEKNTAWYRECHFVDEFYTNIQHFEDTITVHSAEINILVPVCGQHSTTMSSSYITTLNHVIKINIENISKDVEICFPLKRK